MSFPATALLTWYDRHRRSLPWRAGPGETADPYHVWLSEIMLQQTTVAATIPYYERFLRRFPTIAALAAAPLEDVLAAWAGLGYYARARNLHACARVVAAAGGFPRDLAGLRDLPGIGEYTAAAVGAIAFGVPAVPVDGNVERVVARLFAVDEAIAEGEAAVASASRRGWGTMRRRGRGRRILPRRCSISAPPSARRACRPARLSVDGGLCRPPRGIAADLPRKAAKRARPLRHGVHFWLTDRDGNVLLRRRQQNGLLGGMTELPGTEWRPMPWDTAEALALAPMDARLARGRRGASRFHAFRTDAPAVCRAGSADRGGRLPTPDCRTGGRGAAVGDAQVRADGGGSAAHPEPNRAAYPTRLITQGITAKPHAYTDGHNS